MIGICGLEHGCGTTCVSLLFSNYLSNKLKKRTAYVELNATNEISSLCKNTDTARFRHLGISFFPNATLVQLPDILQLDFEYFVLDIGIPNIYTAQEFLRCDKQFMIGSLSEWKTEKTRQKLEQLIKQTSIHPECITFLGNPLRKESLRSNSFASFFRVVSLPYIKNPFQITSNYFSFCEIMLERNRHTTI